MIYLDNNATTPIDPRVAEAMQPYLTTHFGNPSSRHAFGRRAREAVDRARAQVAGLLGCRPDEIVFTSGGTESNNLALKGVCETVRGSGAHVVTSTVEHPAVSEVCDRLESDGCGVSRVGVDDNGLVTPSDIAAAMRQETAVVSIMHAQNEVGAIQPIREIAKIAHESGALMHCDAAQSVGKIETRVDALGVDLMSIAAHKFYGPKGVGALYVRDGVQLVPQMQGAGHERGLRPGTESVLLLVGMGAAAQLAAEEIEARGDLLKRLRDGLEDRLIERAAPVIIHAAAAPRLPNTCSIAFPGSRAVDILDNLQNVACSAGSACHEEGLSISPVLAAMGLPADIAGATLRLSLGRFTTARDIDAAAADLAAAVDRSRKSG